MVRKVHPARKSKSPPKRSILRNALGVLFVGLSLWGAGSYWVSRRPSGNGDPTGSLSSSSARTSSEESSIAKGPLTTLEISTKLGYSDEATALADARVFLDRVRSGFLPKEWVDECHSEKKTPVCDAVGGYFSDVLGPSRRRLRPRSRPLRTPLKIKFINKLQSEDFQPLLGALSNKSIQFLREMGEKARSQNACPRNLSLALARVLEKHTPKKGVLALLNALDDHGVSCVDSEEPLAEFHGLRIGLLRWAQGRREAGLESFIKSSQASVKREEHRTLYWIWKAARELVRKDVAQKALERLQTVFPLSWYAILSHHELGSNPYAFFDQNRPATDLVASGNEAFDRSFYWGLLMLRSDSEGRGLGRYAETLTQNIPPDISPGAVQYFARMMDEAGEHRSQIVALTNFLNARPREVSPEMLRLLFPRPYFQDIARLASPLLDYAVLLGLARQESSFNIKAVSTANAKGLFQVLPSTARSMKRNVKIHDYLHNIEVGTKYFLKLVQSLDGSIEKSLASYNAGRGNVNKWEESYSFVRFSPEDPQLWSDLIPFRETRDYVSTVLRNAYWYHRLYPDLRARLGQGMLTSPLLLRFLLAPESSKESTGTASN